MAKVLISFLGTGPLIPNGAKREYQTANYHLVTPPTSDSNLSTSDLGNFPFVSAALKKHHKADKLLLIGTVHSMWEEVYRWFSADANKDIDEDVYFDIANACENANYKSDLEIPHQEDIEQALGEGSKVILIKYGITEKEIAENINIILNLKQYLHNNDELIVDVTHSFRSLPMFIMNLLIYLQNASDITIHISHIHYGMLEMRRELGYAPILDLKSIMDVNAWITGAYSFLQFGNTYKIAQLLQSENKSVANVLKNFSDAMNTNYMYTMQTEIQKLSAIKNKQYKTMLPEMIINPIVEKFVKTFSVSYKKYEHSHFQLKMARWQFDHKKYAQAYLTSNEAIITHICEQNMLQWDDKEQRDFVKNVLLGILDENLLDVDVDLAKLFRKHNSKRNGIAHTKILKTFDKEARKEDEMNLQEIIDFLENNLGELESLWGISTNSQRNNNK